LRDGGEQQALAKVVLRDPAVESLSSFIGIDGTKHHAEQRRMLINLKPLAERKLSASEVMRRLQDELRGVQNVALYLQPVQDLTIEDGQPDAVTVHAGRTRRE